MKLPEFAVNEPDWRSHTQIAADQVPIVSRKDHVREFAENYEPGQHLTAIGPTGRGKTKLISQLLVATLRRMRHRKLSAIILHGKIRGRDETIQKLSDQGFPVSADARLSRLDKWKWQLRHQGKPILGYIVRPLDRPAKMNEDDKLGPTEKENNLLKRAFRRAINIAYHATRKRPVILVIDEGHQAHEDLGLRKDCEGPLMRGRPVCGEWTNIQRGRYVSHMCFDQAEYVYIFWDPTKDNQDRYAEIGGVDPALLKELSNRLEKHTAPDGSTYTQCIYFKRSGDKLCIVDT